MPYYDYDYYDYYDYYDLTCRGIVALLASTLSSAAVASHVSTCSRSFALRVSSWSRLARTWDGEAQA